MLNHKGLTGCIFVCILFSACAYLDMASSPSKGTVPVLSSDCNKETQQMTGVIETLHNKANSLEMKNKELASLNNTLKNKSGKLELEILKRDAVIQIQGNVIKLLDDPEKTIETGLKEEINTKIGEMEEARKSKKQVFTVGELFVPKTLDISSKGQTKLLALADAVKNYHKQMIYIEGHTDNVPVSAALQAKYPTNWEVSISRAAAVARFLHSNAGIEPERIVVVGYGSYKPVASNETEEGRKANRRVEIYFGPPL